MRYICNKGYNPKKWEKLARIKLMSLINCSDKKVFFDAAKNSIWTCHKDYFLRLSNNKCWFTEAKLPVAKFEIEHFRPKRKVNLIKSKSNYPERRKDTDKDGYWWLAYDLRNFRLAGPVPNNLKGNYFPLERTSIIANELDNSWLFEKPILVDPCKLDEVKLISFEGPRAVPKQFNSMSLEYIRADISIKIFGLNNPVLLKSRSEKYQKLLKVVTRAKTNLAAMNNYLNNPNIEAFEVAQYNFNEDCSDLISMLNPNHEYTKMIYCYLNGLNLEWIETYVLDIARRLKYLNF